MVNGPSYVVRHPEFVALPQSGRQRHIVYFGEDGVHLLDLALIQEVVLAEDPTATVSRPDEGDGGP
jgi:hypothetical protein